MDNPTRVPFHGLLEMVRILAVSLTSSCARFSRAQIAIESIALRHDGNELNGQ